LVEDSLVVGIRVGNQVVEDILVEDSQVEVDTWVEVEHILVEDIQVGDSLVGVGSRVGLGNLVEA